jgi:hypothetical protein
MQIQNSEIIILYSPVVFFITGKTNEASLNLPECVWP